MRIRRPGAVRPSRVHPPAGATTLIVSLGIVTDVFHLVVIEIAVVLLTVQAVFLNRYAGIDYPIWSLREPAL